MKNFFIYSLLVLFLALVGCGKESKKDIEIAKKIEAEKKLQVKCTSCKVTSTLGEYQVVSQVLSRCPFCKKVINIKEAQFGKKKLVRKK